MSSVCRVCLAGNKVLKSLKNTLLVDLYEKLSTAKFNFQDPRPKALCSSCYQKLLKCLTFSQMAHRSEKIFTHLFHKGLEATQANINEMTMNDSHSSVVPMQFTTIDGEITNAATQVPIKDEPISSIVIKEEATTETDIVVEIDSAQYCIQSQFKLEDKSGQRNETEALPFIVQDEQTKPDGSRSLMEPSSSNEFHEQFNQNGHLVECMHIHTWKMSLDCNTHKQFYQKCNLVKHMKTNTGEKPFVCNVCYKQFNRNDHVVRHMRIHTGEKPFVCKVCDKQFTQKSSLVSHTKTHTGEKPFACSECDKQYNRKYDLVEHLRLHTGERPCVCNVCGKQFTLKSSLDFHTKIHTGEKPFACSECDKQFNRKYNLVEHLRIHTGERPFVCNVCRKQFNRKKHLVEHMRIHTGEKPFVCNVCHKKYSRKSNLVKHSENHRGEKPPQTQQPI